MALNDSKPVIGITSYLQTAKWGVWDSVAAILPFDYVREVAAAGACPVLLPPIGTEPTVLDRLDGLIIAGGTDINPEVYGAETHRTTAFQDDRDTHDIALTRYALEHSVPLLAICRGLQVLNVALGGTLHQNIPDILGTNRHRPAPAMYGEVPVSVTEGSLLAGILGGETTASCYHHQAVDQVGAGLDVVGKSEDGMVEALELATDSPYGGWVLGVQWHPEHNPKDRRIIDSFVAEVNKKRIQE